MPALSVPYPSLVLFNAYAPAEQRCDLDSYGLLPQRTWGLAGWEAEEVSRLCVTLGDAQVRWNPGIRVQFKLSSLAPKPACPASSSSRRHRMAHARAALTYVTMLIMHNA